MVANKDLYKIAGVCLSVYVSVITPALAILNRTGLLRNFARSFGAVKLRSCSLGGQNPIMPSPILPKFSPIFITPNAFSMGRCKHCSIDAR